MPYDPQKHHRRSVRLKDYDYSQNGAYFVTICAYHMVCLFGYVNRDAEMCLNVYGRIVLQEWQRTGEMRPHIELDSLVVMPNHVHGIVMIHDTEASRSHRARQASPLRPEVKLGVDVSLASGQPKENPSGSLGAIIGGFKSSVTKEINRLRQNPGAMVWQRSFHDVIIRNEAMLDSLRQYILTNPGRWAEDKYYAE